jgi:hypothetical protein
MRIRHVNTQQKRPDNEDARTKLKTQGQESRRMNQEIPTKKEERDQKTRNKIQQFCQLTWIWIT